MRHRNFFPTLFLAFCAAAALPAYASGSPNNGASGAFLEAAALQLEYGEVELAGDTLERALRIEPNNPAILHQLGQVRFQQGQYAQAVALAMRSNARTRNDADLRSRNLQLIQSARQAMGPGVAGGSEAEVEVDEQAEVRVGLDQYVPARHAAGVSAGGVESY
ncbi:tetratricopeptide repeat protein [Metapseudomonas lalkuanensis]|uniref:Tetratricopeptide repeat protein n=1 Tax=Metapseudomonas lalkuanensis TaxID=2604832 RepID=A0A5J6QNS3_9GAMM|nr:tetratricopeptide repeat protein [Pseudomonas lalkuanensis]QEY62476.1 tetratricopeptide repeat protein [Pseudomonas lalkuanensis]